MRKGFTLVELSVVIAIIGLIIGGVMVGQNLVFAAQVRAQVKQLEEYRQAYTVFQTKYNCIPGDCYNATTFFSSTTNGNGNGKIEDSAYGGGNYDSDGYFDLEKPLFFTHLILSGLIISEPQLQTLGYPEPRFPHEPKQGFVAASAMLNDLASVTTFSMQSDDYFGEYKWKSGLYFDVGRPSVGWGYKNDKHGLFTPLATYSMDAKIDDGNPQTGDFKGGTVQWTNTGGYTDGYCLYPTPPSLPAPAGLGTQYNISNTKTPCVFAWRLE